MTMLCMVKASKKGSCHGSGGGSSAAASGMIGQRRAVSTAARRALFLQGLFSALLLLSNGPVAVESIQGGLHRAQEDAAEGAALEDLQQVEPAKTMARLYASLARKRDARRRNARGSSEHQRSARSSKETTADHPLVSSSGSVGFGRRRRRGLGGDAVAFAEHSSLSMRDEGGRSSSKQQRTNSTTMSRHGGRQEAGKVLYSVYSDALFYGTRLSWIMKTWGQRVPKRALSVVGDKPLGDELPFKDSVRFEATECPQGSHWEGACCKYAEAVIKAHEVMQQEPSFEWAYFTDDDAYVRPEMIAEALEQKKKADGGDAHGDHAVVYGIFGCATKSGCQGLCAGGGYAASRRAVELMVKDDEEAFMREQMQMCQKCDRWADQALTGVMDERGIAHREIEGLYGWPLSTADFRGSLKGELPAPLMFHYIRTEHQMEFLDKLFSSTEPGYFDGVGHQFDSAPASTKKNSKGEEVPCFSYDGNYACVISNRPEDAPFSDAGTPQMNVLGQLERESHLDVLPASLPSFFAGWRSQWVRKG